MATTCIQADKLASVEAIINLIFQELKSFQKDMRDEIEKIKEKVEVALVFESGIPSRTFKRNKTTNSPKQKTEGKNFSSESGFRTKKVSDGEDSGECRDTNEVIDITDFFDDLEVQESCSSPIAPIEQNNSSSHLFSTSHTFLREESIMPSEDTAKTGVSRISDSETDKNLPSCSTKCQEETKLPTSSKSQKPSKMTPSSLKSSQPKEVTESAKSFFPTPAPIFKNNINRVTPEMLNEFLSNCKDSCRRKKRKIFEQVKTITSTGTSSIPIGILVDPDTGVMTYECPFCYKRASRYCDIKCHAVIHTGERPFKCIFCNKAFKRAYHMRCHMRTHTGEKLKCDKCDKEYVNMSALKAHKILHEKDELRFQKIADGVSQPDVIIARERPYRCMYCDRLFTQKTHLDSHISATHLGKKDFRCVVCSKEFSRKDNMITHMRIHTGERPFKCPNCPKRFSDSSTFRKHRKTMHK